MKIWVCGLIVALVGMLGPVAHGRSSSHHASGSSHYTSHSRSSSHHSSGTSHHSSHRATGEPRDRHGRIRRSRVARSSFEHSHPCPATGKSYGRCPGYVVDHVRPLECGGPDSPTNMQWQTAAAAHAKDKTETSCR